jgi:hypothetical protein
MCISLNLICKLFDNSLLCDAWNFYIHIVFEPTAKKHLPFFSCFVKKKYPCFVKISMLRKNFQASWKYPCFVRTSKLCKQGIPSFATELTKLYFLALCLGIFSFLQNILRRSTSYSIRVIRAIWCMMWCYAWWCNDMMQRMMLMPKMHTHTPTLKHTISAFP